MDLFAPAQTDTTHAGLATQHCLTLIIKLQEAFYPVVCASGDVKRIADLFSKSPPSGLNISPGGGWFISQTRSALRTTAFWWSPSMTGNGIRISTPFSTTRL
jgi:hypothetical protein